MKINIHKNETKKYRMEVKYFIVSKTWRGHNFQKCNRFIVLKSFMYFMVTRRKTMITIVCL